MVALTAVVTMDKDTWSHDVTPLPMELLENNLKLQFQLVQTPLKQVCWVQEIIQRAGEAFEQSGAKYLVDPVMVCKGEDEVNPGNTDAMIKYLLPKATVVTPNLFEAGQLSGLGKLTSIADMKQAAKIIHDQGAQHVIIKGGKALDQDKSYDLYFDGANYYQLTTDMFQQSYNHGAGCTAAATTAYLANGKSPKRSCYCKVLWHSLKWLENECVCWTG